MGKAQVEQERVLWHTIPTRQLIFAPQELVYNEEERALTWVVTANEIILVVDSQKAPRRRGPGLTHNPMNENSMQ